MKPSEAAKPNPMPGLPDSRNDLPSFAARTALYVRIRDSHGARVLALSAGSGYSVGRSDPARQEGSEPVSPPAADQPETDLQTPVGVESPYISSRHAQVRLSPDGRMVIKDLDSTNGTWLRLAPFTEVTLPPAFEVRLGSDVLLEGTGNAWEFPSDELRFASAEDLAAYVRSRLSGMVDRVSIIGLGEQPPGRGLSSRFPLTDGSGFLCVIWGTRTWNPELESWTRSCVLLFNSGVLSAHQRMGEGRWRFVAASPNRRRILQLAQRLADTGGAVLLCGPSGVGKDVLAHDLHNNSVRKNGRFVAVNCAALPAELAEAELFGSVKGAFTGSTGRTGLFESAEGGTLLLDEVGELPLFLQAKLLRFAESRTFRRVGETAERSVNVRLLAATCRNLERMVHEGSFRSDLFFRLSTVSLDIPPLEGSDLLALAPVLLTELIQESGVPLPIEETEALVSRVAHRRWPGNGREVRNVLQRYLCFRDPACSAEQNWQFAIGDAELANTGSSSRAVALPDPALALGAEPLPDNPLKSLDHIRALLILSAVKKEGVPLRWSTLAKAAKRLGLTSAGLGAALERLGLQLDKETSAAQVDDLLAREKQSLEPYVPVLLSMLT